MAVSLKKLQMVLFKNTSVAIFILVFLSFGLINKAFFNYQNIQNIIVNASYIGVLAIGMTFVLLTGGIDLSVGSIMYITWITAGALINNGGYPIWLALIVVLLMGLLFGLLNTVLIVKLKISPFLATLSTMMVGRGLGMLISDSQTHALPLSIVSLGARKFIGIPFPILLFALIAILAHILLKKTAFGRQLYAVGYNFETAKKAGINTTFILSSVYVISAFVSVIAGILAIMQIGTIDASFGQGDEFDAIAAAVLGGSSLFGGIGNVLPGTVMGALIVQTVNTGLVYLQVDVYVQPLVSALVIFLAVYIDSLKNARIKKMEQRNIRVEK